MAAWHVYPPDLALAGAGYLIEEYVSTAGVNNLDAACGEDARRQHGSPDLVAGESP